MRKKLLLFLAVFTSACSPIDQELKKAIAFEEIKELNNYSENIEKNLIVRLFRSPIEKENCFIETHGICQYQYYITVSTFDEKPNIAIYKISKKGEIDKINWIESKDEDTATIEFSMTSFSKAALENNPSLKSDTQILKVKVSPTHIEESTTALP